LKGSPNLQSVVVANPDGERELPCHELIAKLGYAPNTEAFIDQLKSDERGHVIVDQSFATSIDGVFAGGDIVQPGYDRIAFASGSGMMAAQIVRPKMVRKSRVDYDPTRQLRGTPGIPVLHKMLTKAVRNLAFPQCFTNHTRSDFAHFA
jgi:pyruvate/2-oxoglutarate dehydrogenase complex dihydrolipoamide dehydrogenase (E3) component